MQRHNNLVLKPAILSETETIHMENLESLKNIERILRTIDGHYIFKNKMAKKDIKDIKIGKNYGENPYN